MNIFAQSTIFFDCEIEFVITEEKRFKFQICCKFLSSFFRVGWRWWGYLILKSLMELQVYKTPTKKEAKPPWKTARTHYPPLNQSWHLSMLKKSRWKPFEHKKDVQPRNECLKVNYSFYWLYWTLKFGSANCFVGTELSTLNSKLNFIFSWWSDNTIFQCLKKSWAVIIISN